MYRFQGGPMAMPLRRLTPERSPRHALGAEIRRLRQAAGLSQATLAAKVYVSASALGKAEIDARMPSEQLVGDLDKLLGAAGGLVELRAAAVAGRAERTGPSQSRRR